MQYILQQRTSNNAQLPEEWMDYEWFKSQDEAVAAKKTVRKRTGATYHSENWRIVKVVG